MLRLIFIVFMLMLWPAAAWADVAALSYNDPENNPQTVSPSKQFINPAGPLGLYLNAGLDRKVGYVLTNSTGHTVATGVSGLITPADTITVLGQTYYGKVLTVPVVLDDGTYTLAGQILDSAGQVVAAQSYPLVVDRIPPEAGDLWWRAWGLNASIMNNELVAPYHAANILIKQVRDALGIDLVKFESFDPGTGNVYYSKPAWYDSAQETAGVGNGNPYSVAVGSYLPYIDGPLGVRFIIYDKAGNKRVAQTTVRYNGRNDPAPELIAVYNPNLSTEYIPGSGLVGYEAYTPGMTTYANPMKLLYRVSRSNWTTYNPDYGLSALEGTVVYTDSQSVYVCFEAPFNSTGHLYSSTWRFLSPGWWGTHSIYFNLVLAATAPQSPTFVAWQYYRSDIGWSDLTTDDFRPEFNIPVAITKIRAVVEPRNYPQYFYTPGSGTCTIPAGETECVLDTNLTPPTPGNIKLYNEGYKIKNQENSLISATKLAVFEWDLAPPSITSFNVDQATKKVVFVVNEPGTGSYWGNIKLASGWLMAHNTVTGQEVQVNGVVQALSGNNSQVTVDYSSLHEGEWQFTLWAKDNFDNSASQSAGQLALDATPPTVRFFRETSAMADHDATDSLGKLSFTVTDNVDSSPLVESVRLTGGPQNTDVYLAYRLQQGAYLLEYPVLHPSSGQEYTLAVTAKDAMGNRITKTLPFSYSPPTVQLSSGGQGTLNLPALPAAVVHADGGNPLVTEPLTVAGQAVSGVYDLVVVSGSGSTATAVVHNVTVAPGEQKIISGYDFSAHGGRLDLPLWSEQPGEAHLVVTSLAPNFPVLTASVRFWQPELTLTADPGWGVQPVIQTQKIGASVSGAPCLLAFDAQEAQAADPIDSPRCLVEYTRKPVKYQLQDGLLQGVLGPDDPLAVDYQVSVYNAGQKYVFANGSHALERLPVTDVSVTLAATPGAEVFRKVQALQIAAQTDGAITCKTTSSETRARQFALSNVVCLVRWTQTPDGLNLPSEETAALSGSLQDLGEQTLTATVDLYTPAGIVPNAFTRTLALASANPPIPTLGFVPGLYGEKVEEGYFVTPELSRGEFGMVQFTPSLTRANFTLEIEGGEEGLKSYPYMTTNQLTFSRAVYAGPLNVWQTKGVTVRAYYTDFPEMKAEHTLTIMGVPSKRVQAVLTGPRETTDTVGVPVKLQIGLPGRGTEITYDPERDGTWETRFGLLDNRQQFQPLTEYQEVSGGVLETTLRDFAVGYVQLSAQARLKPPSGTPGYDREIRSSNLYTTVLRGSAPEGRLICRSPSGPSPLSTAVALAVDNDSLRVLGDVAWEMSGDDGGTWQPVTVKAPMQAMLSLDTGQYLVRARLSNKITQESGYTESLTLVSYKVPRLVVLGPRAVFVGSPVNLAAQMDVEGQVLSGDQVVVEWYNAKNQKVHEGPALSLTPQDPLTLNYRVRARLKEAPATDMAAWRTANAAVQVMPPRAPGAALVVPNYMEYNTVSAQSYNLSAKLVLPLGLDTGQYPVHGEWRLPDGRTVEGLEASYTPTAQDGAKRQALFEFAAWIEGYQSQTTMALRRLVSVGMYTWPEFRLNVKADPMAAPSMVTLTMEPVGLSPGLLQKPAYEWQLPAGVEKVRDLDGSRAIQAYFPNPGDYEVSVRITDVRGSTAQATAAVALTEPPPFEVTFYPLFSNILRRELVDVSLRPSVRGGHPRDRLVTWQFTVDDPQAQVLGVNENSVIKGLHSGDRLIRLRAESKLGKVVEVDYPFTVMPNQPPACTVSSYDTADARWFNASCKDPDGRVVATRWFLGEQQISLGQTIRFVRGTSGVLRFEAEDDSGAKYNEVLTTP